MVGTLTQMGPPQGMAQSGGKMGGQPGGKMSGQPAYGVNPMQNASQSMQQGFNTMNQALGQNNQFLQQGFGQYNPSQMGATGYNPANMTPASAQAANMNAAQYDAQGMNAANYDPSRMNAAQYGAQGMNAANYGAATMKGAGYNARKQGGPGTIANAMGAYQNPYQDQVIDRTTDQMMRQNAMSQDQNMANATSAGAFGGSRHGVVEAMTNAETNRQVGDMSAQLNQQGFDAAAALGGQDISNRMDVRSQNQAATNMQRQFNAANTQQGRMANMDAKNQARQYNAGNRQQARMAEMAARNQAGQYNAGNRQQGRMANMDAKNQARQYNTGNRQQTRMAEMAAQNQAGQYNAGNRQQSHAANMAARNQNRQFNTGNRQQGRMANMAANNVAAQYGASNQQQANMQNMAAQNQAGQFNAGTQQQNLQSYMNNAFGGASGLTQMGQNSYNVGSNINQQQMQAGGMARALQQAVLSGGQDMFGQYANQPTNSMNTFLASLGMNPMNNTGTQTTTQDKGWGEALAGVASAGAGAMSFAPIAFSSIRFKENVEPTGNTLTSTSGKVVDEVVFNYIGGDTQFTGVIAEDLGADDPATHTDRYGNPIAVDYSKLRR